MKQNHSFTKILMLAGCLAFAGNAHAQLAPLAVNDAASVAAGGTVNINVLGNDTYIGTPVIAEYSEIVPSVGTLVKNGDNSFSYTAPTGYSGTVTFTYTIRTCNITNAPIGHTYQFVSAPGIKWTDAKIAAEGMQDILGRQGYLATITSEAENVLAYAATQFLLPNGQPYGHPVWLGGSDAGEEGVWKWVTGPEAGMQFSEQDLSFNSFVDGFLPQLSCAYHKWANHEPNQNNGEEEDYLQLQGQNQWNDMRNELNAADMDGYLVEFGGMDANDPALTSTATVTITINGGTPTPPNPTPNPSGPCVTLTVTPSSTTYTGGVATNIYIGYGPQSATIKANICDTGNNNNGCGNNNNGWGNNNNGCGNNNNNNNGCGNNNNNNNGWGNNNNNNGWGNNNNGCGNNNNNNGWGNNNNGCGNNNNNGWGNNNNGCGNNNNNGWGNNNNGCGNNNNNNNSNGGYTYSWSPSAHLSNANIQNPVFTPTSSGVYTYTVTVTKNGASTTKSVTFCVKDIRVPNNNNGWGNGCGNNNQQKVYLCHKTYGWGGNVNTQTLAVPVNQVAAYLNNYSQDRLGSCSQTCGGSARGISEEVIDVTNFELQAYPNPTDGAFTVIVPFSLNDVVVRVFDVYGKMVTTKTIQSGDARKLEFDITNLTSGMYMIDVTDGTLRTQAKITKQ